MQPSRPDIVQANVQVYEETAESYRAGRETYLPVMRAEMDSFVKALVERGAKHVIDIGSGAGVHAQVCAEAGLQMTCIDASEKMLSIVAENVPTAIVNVADFWTYEPSRKFDGVIMASFIHLFPKEDLPKVIARVNSWCNPGALAWVATVTQDKPNDGEWLAKEENHGGAKRWRVVYTETELLHALRNLGLRITELIHAPDGIHSDKVWLDVICRFPGAP